jgi:hypothetical protein
MFFFILTNCKNCISFVLDIYTGIVLVRFWIEWLNQTHILSVKHYIESGSELYTKITFVTMPIIYSIIFFWNQIESKLTESQSVLVQILFGTRLIPGNIIKITPPLDTYVFSWVPTKLQTEASKMTHPLEGLLTIVNLKLIGVKSQAEYYL